MTGRFALYYAPEPGGALDRFGWGWLGREPATAAPTPLPALGWAADFHERLIAAPRLYGLHATLKPPFALADGATRVELVEEMRRFCADHVPVAAAPLELAEIEGFLALRPSRAAPAIDALANACVEAFDRFRAPPGDAERAKRLAHPLSPRQIELLDRWGYPYVMEQFRFHVTLTDRLDPRERDTVRAVLPPLLRDVEAEPLRIDSLCLFEQEAAGRWFTLAERIPLTGR